MNYVCTCVLDIHCFFLEDQLSAAVKQEIMEETQEETQQSNPEEQPVPFLIKKEISGSEGNN